MAVTSLVFVGFVLLTILIYYLLPKKWQWIVLLAASLVFYLVSSGWGILFVLITACTVYGAANRMASLSTRQRTYLKEHREDLSREEKKAYKEKTKKARRRVMTSVIVLNVAILCFFKYAHFAVWQYNGVVSLFGGKEADNSFQLLSVLGISFYTFQSIGYLADVYWELCEAQRNFAKFLLFVSFFPQITQGPISEYGQLGKALFSEHAFSYTAFSRGFQRLLWGMFKKVVIADYLAPFVADAFENYPSYSGTACLIAAFGYSVQIYADFSGYMDIMCGVCEMFGIALAENFDRPYFSKSVAEYWRRWHITLGAWFKKYVYYPIAVSRWNRSLAKKSARFGKTVSENLPATLALVVVWLLTGLWHGASWAYIAWGGVNGLFIIFSMWMEPVYAKAKTALRIRENTFAWRAFQTIRSFVLITLIKVLPEVGTLKQGIGFIVRIFTAPVLSTNLKDYLPFLKRAERSWFVFVCGCILLLFLVSLIQRKRQIRDFTAKLPMPLRSALLAVCSFVLLMLSFKTATEDPTFLYAAF